MGSRHRGPAAEIAALNAFIKLQRAAESVSTRVHTVLPADLTVTQFGVLDALYHLGPLCQGELAEKLLRSGGNLTLVVNNLEKSGYVRRERDATDRRFVVVRLTPRGERLIAEVFPRVALRVTAEMGQLTAAELSELDRLCRKVGRPAPA
jgi:MarR family transcriptional regulator, 2-MHQ and catechol-resistance regulon repressor